MIDVKIQNELRARYNPDGSQLRTLQMNLLDILVEFDRVCRKYGITYWLDSGSLLGAARHGGFIPWDDDIDVCILRKDRKRLNKAMGQELGQGFTYVDADSSQGYTRRWARVLNNNVYICRNIAKPGSSGETEVRKEHIWMDVFLETNGNPAVSRKLDFIYGRCHRRRFRQIDDGKLKHLAGVCLYPFIKMLVWAARLWGNIFNRGNLIHDFGTGFYSQRKMDEVFPLGEIEFEGHSFKAPGKWDSYLKRIYGNWDTLPENAYNHNIFEVYLTTGKQ